MSSVMLSHPRGPPTPPQDPATVKVHALQAGRLTLPERFFVSPASETARRTVPSLSFLIQHEDCDTGKKTRIVLDLGIRRDIERYPGPIQRHIDTRQPLTTDPDVVKSLSAGGLAPEDIDYVVYSHVHWDHVGEPRDFKDSTFIIGHGALSLLKGTPSSLKGSHSFFESDLLPANRTLELADPSNATSNPPSPANSTHRKCKAGADFTQPWSVHPTLNHVIDVFRDGSLLVVNAPGHLPGHINILARTGLNETMYLAGDACHDRRIMRREREIGEWKDAGGHICCIHANKAEAENTIEKIRMLEEEGTEVIFAHDVEWEEDQNNLPRFFGWRSRI